MFSRSRRRAASAEAGGWPAGHFYSPLPDLADVAARERAIFETDPALLPGIDLGEARQLELLRLFRTVADQQPWGDEPRSGLRFSFANDYFGRGEAVALFCMLKLLRPRRVIEVGCGHSSAALLDALDDIGGPRTRCTFIDPYPQRLMAVLDDRDDLDVRVLRLQEIETALFTELGDGDVLLVDSTHVLKVDSDVCHLLFRVFPALAPGVRVHIHDIYWPFEYPREWVLGGRAWNEAYALRAFLQFNRDFRIVYFGSYLGARRPDALAAALPAIGGHAGSSLWLERVAGAGA